MQNSECDKTDCPRNNKNYDGPFYFPHNKTKVRFMVVTEQYPPGRRYDEKGKIKCLMDIENELAEQCKNYDKKSVVPKYILGIFGRDSLNIRNGPVYWTHMIKCFSNFEEHDLTFSKKKEDGHPENKKNIRQSSSRCSKYLQNEISEFKNLEFIIPFGQSAMKSVFEAIAGEKFSSLFNQQIDLKKPFYRVICEAPYKGYSVTIGKEKLIRILPFYHPSRRNIFESHYPELADRTNINNISDQPGSFVKILRDNFHD